MKCFRCRQLLEFDKCVICRLIPESTTKIVLKTLIKEYELGNEFSTDSIENLIPCCRPCSKDKAARTFRHSPSLKSWFEMIRSALPQIEAKIKLIDGEQSAEAALRLIAEKLERGELRTEDLEKVVKPFLELAEGRPKDTVELRLSDTVRLFYSVEGLRMQPVSEIRYEKFVDGMLESGEWKRRSPEQIREGPKFGEGR